MTKRIFLFAVVLIFGFSAKGQSVQEIEDSILHYAHSIEKWDTSREEEYQYDSLDFASYSLLNYLKSTLVKNSASLKYDFKRLEKTRIKVRSSDDKKFRIYCWNVGGAGSAQSYDALLQYEGPTGSTVNILNDDSKMQEGYVCSGSFCTALYTISTKNRQKIYVTVSSSITSNSGGGMEIKAYAIEKGKLNDSIKLFKTATKTLNNISFYYNYSTPIIRNYADFFMSKDKQRLSIPIISAEGEVSSKYLVYTFDGDYYVFHKNLK